MPVPPAPPFDSLRIDPSGPPGNAWGRFGASDHLGMLNLLTPSTVVAAAQEIRTGVRVSLDWPLDKPQAPSFNRQRLDHRILHKPTSTDPRRPVHDDVLTFNTQSSTQWDGFRHYGHPASGTFYAGTTLEQIASDPTKIGIDAIADAGGIVGRGVLVDYARWADAQGTVLKPFETEVIPLENLLKAVEHQQVEFRQGDILIVRSGFTRAYDALSTEEKEALPKRETTRFSGVESSRSTLEWLWKQQFAAVASDAVAFEAYPLGTGDPEHALHEWLLPRWGMRKWIPFHGGGGGADNAT